MRNMKSDVFPGRDQLQDLENRIESNIRIYHWADVHDYCSMHALHNTPRQSQWSGAHTTRAFLGLSGSDLRLAVMGE